eukprot:scaffold39337_cov25-Cyclotella_meneghiniana.AAC.1
MRNQIELLSCPIGIPMASWCVVALVIFTAASIAIAIVNATRKERHVRNQNNKRGRRLSANKTSDKTKKLRSSSAAAAAGTQSIAAAFLRTDEKKQESLQKLYTGKYILLKASAIYGGKSKVPSGEENYLFKYSVSEVEDDTSASIDYSGKYIVEGGQEWKSYPALNETDWIV